MYCSTDNNNDVEMLSESRKLLLLNISTPSHLPAVLIVWVSKRASTESKETGLKSETEHTRKKEK